MPEGKAPVPWAELEAEYLSGDMTLKELAQEWGVNYDSLKKRASRGQWVKNRKNMDKVQSMSRLALVTERLLIQISKSIDTEGMEAKDYKALSSALKELTEIKERLEQADKTEDCGLKVELSERLQELCK